LQDLVGGYGRHAEALVDLRAAALLDEREFMLAYDRVMGGPPH
jgi:hypothetical protein